MVSTCLSVEPAQSLWGDYQTGTGTFTYASYVVLFAGIAGNLRGVGQVERFAGAVLAGSLPVSLYALAQRLNLDPIDWGAYELMTSLVGHPLYLAGYLGMVFPLFLWRSFRTSGQRLFSRGPLERMPKLMLSQQPILLPGGARDKFHAVRSWFGYGPETIIGVLAQRYISPHTDATLEDRFHNLVWDLWENVGGVGVLAFLAFLAALNYCGLRQLDFDSHSTRYSLVSAPVAWFLTRRSSYSLRLERIRVLRAGAIVGATRAKPRIIIARPPTTALPRFRIKWHAGPC